MRRGFIGMTGHKKETTESCGDCGNFLCVGGNGKIDKRDA